MNPLALVLVSIAALFQPPFQPPFQEGTPLEQRSKAVVRMISAQPEWSADLFDAQFLKAVPPERLRALSADLFAKYGPIDALNLLKQESAYSAKYEAVMAKGFVIPVTLGLDQKPPHSVVSLWFGVPAPMLADLAAVAAEFEKLPGSTSFGIYELGGKEPVALVEHEGDQALAIGSAFKLYVLGALARQLEQGERKAADTLALDARWMSVPSGKLHKWPAGTPVTLATLAGLMISESDNTATDHLLFALGRAKVEEQLALMGNAHAERNVPFLSTGELFRLKLVGGERACSAYTALGAAERRAYLDGEVAALPLDARTLDTSAMARPVHIDTIEWFASARDLARACDWLRSNTESPKAALVRGLLAINPGLDVSSEAFPYVGFKGGSETGVMQLCHLLRAKSGKWYAVAAGWNDPKAGLDEARFAGLATRALHVLAKHLAKEAEAKPEPQDH